MTYRINLGSRRSRVRLSSQQGIRVNNIPAPIIDAKSFSELIDVDVADVHDKYVIMYDAITEKYTAVNPDEVLSASSTLETTQPGLPSDFINTLDIALDNKIDLDAGSF